MIDPKTPTAYGEDFKQVRRASAPDPFTFVVEYARPFAPALASWGMDVLPKHLLEKYPDISKSPLNKKPVGTGPYRFVEWKTGEKVVFDANPDYFEGKPYIARVITRVIPDQATMFLELKSGGVDMMTLTPPQYSRQTETPDFRASFNKYKYLASAYTYLGFRLSHPFFKDRRVRQAIALAADKKALIDGVLLGLGQEATGPFKPGTWAYNPNVRKYPHDPARAKALLAEAGWKEKNGTLVKDGQTFEFTVLTNAGNEARAKTAAILQQNLAEVGITMKIRTVEWAAFINQFIDKRDFDAVILGWSLTPDPDQYDIWHSSKTGPKELNFVGFSNPEDRRTARGGAKHLRHREAEEGILPDPGDPGGGAAVRLSLRSGRAAGGPEPVPRHPCPPPRGSRTTSPSGTFRRRCRRTGSSRETVGKRCSGIIARRLLLTIPLLVGITLISFLMIHMAPGGPISLTTDLNPGRPRSPARAWRGITDSTSRSTSSTAGGSQGWRRSISATASPPTAARWPRRSGNGSRSR